MGMSRPPLHHSSYQWASLARGIGFLGTLWLLLTYSIEKSANDPGLGWHLATGRWIATHQTVPQTDPFLFSDAPRPWVADQWLGDLLIYVLYSLGSFPLLYTGLAVLFLLTYWGTLFSFVSRHQDSLLASMLSVVVALKVSLIHFIIRPVPLSFTLFALIFSTCVSAYREERRPPVSISRKSLFALSIAGLLIAWSNVHPSFMMGFFVVATTAFFWPIESFAKPPIARKNASPLLVAGFAGAFIAPLVNPYGIRIFDTLFSSSQWTDVTSEWRPIDFSQPEGTLLLLTLSIIILGYSRYPRTRTDITRLEIFFVVVFGAASLHAVRMVPYFGIAAALPLAISLREIGRELLRRPIRHSSPESSPHTPPGRPAIVVFSVGLLAHSYLTQSVLFFEGRVKECGPSSRVFPIKALSALTQIAAESEPQGVLAEPDWGGAITWYGMGRLRPTIDDRDVLFTPQDYRDNSTLLAQANPATIRAFMAQKRVKYLLIKTDSPLATRLAQTDYVRPLYHDDTAIAFSAAGL